MFFSSILIFIYSFIGTKLYGTLEASLRRTVEFVSCSSLVWSVRHSAILCPLDNRIRSLFTVPKPFQDYKQVFLYFLIVPVNVL